MASPAMVQNSLLGNDSGVSVSISGTRSVPAVEKVFTILEVLARSRTGLTLRELASQCGLPKSSVHGIVVTLQRCGYLYRNHRSSRYLFARKLLMLANDALSGLELRELAEPFMRQVVQRTHFPVHLGIVEFNETVIVAKMEYGSNHRAAASWVGRRMELHCTALGKALISNWSDAELERLAEVRAFPRHNDNTISSLKRLKEELTKVRRLGYATDNEEDMLGIHCLAVPVLDRSGRAFAALSVSGTTEDITSENASIIATELQAAALAFSQQVASSFFPVS